MGEGELHESIAAFLRERRGLAADGDPATNAESRQSSLYSPRLIAAYGRSWLRGLRPLALFAQVVAIEAGEDRLAGLDEYPSVVRAELRHGGRPRGEYPHADAPSEAQQAVRILRDAGLWPWQRALWRGDTGREGPGRRSG